MGRVATANRPSVFELCAGTRGAGASEAQLAARRALALVLVILLTDLALSGYAQYVVAGGPRATAALRSDASDLLAFVAARALVMPLIAFAARIDGYAALAEDGDGLARRQGRADFQRDAWLALLFVLASVCQGYVGVKLCVFDLDGFPKRDRAQIAVAMGCTTLCINAEAWLLSSVVQLRTKLLAASTVHKHPLAYAATQNNWCDVCGVRVTTPHLWRCDACNFDCCPKCWDRAASRDAASTAMSPLRAEAVAENGHRPGGGRGGRGGGGAASAAPPAPAPSSEEVSVTSWEIIVEVAKLMRPDWALVLTAWLCVCASGGAALALPSYQGQIIDAVYGRERGRFRNRLELYLIFSVGTAASQALRAFCFQCVGRRLACSLRNELYRGILRQEIDFFDMNASGTLTSRLTQDCNQMTTPLTTLLGTLTSAIIALVGGVAMAFATSWRLSMLAFTTVGPILHLTQAYAQWSREQNRKILAHLGEANGAATEALANVRTVKAMATEEAEAARYRTHVVAARDRGVVDAALSGGTQLVNNILDYGAGWLILFYGGAAAMRDGSGLSAGKLVTYQLYFTKIQNSYNTLIGLLSSFTRASGAAQRVLGLLRSMPGDGGGGAPPPPHAGTRGARLDYDDVSFSYASRPEKAVLRGLTLVVPAGSTLALVGRSGAGKTTALHMLLRFYEPTGGAIKIDGAALPTLDVRRLRRQFAIVAQETQLFDTTIDDDPGGHQTFETRPTGGRSPRRRQRRVRLRGRVGGRDPRGGRRGARGRVRGGLCGRVRDARRRARRAHLGGAEAANLHRSRVSSKPTRAPLGRGDERARRGKRVQGPGVARRVDREAVRDGRARRASPLDGAQRGQDRGPRRRRGAGDGVARRARRARWHLRAARLSPTRDRGEPGHGGPGRRGRAGARNRPAH